MNAPNLNRALILEAPVHASDGAGGYARDWIALGTLWGEITVRSGREIGRSGAAVSRVTCKIVVRGAPWGTPERPMPQQRFRDGTRIFTIEAVTERDPQAKYLTCFAKEEVAV
ncbi:head-tail adaptor protein [Sulfitobacter aestuariivivens]|uniref:Head-tail adaptor protein n=1 Tax=Sulfitobacter aestuariivivens TaxID=2766981 RepID=A0A927D0R2_9RHOB|nr:head-tail adaptor protein [Sulfitobacter aestuariivivens]MBD3662930.1 head-tail adaptor protein [Sulfitobacter aestuariivivens]